MAFNFNPYREIFNSDSHYYGSNNHGNFIGNHAESSPWMGQLHSVKIELPLLANIMLTSAQA